jgi:hypothetical protein
MAHQKTLSYYLDSRGAAFDQHRKDRPSHQVWFAGQTEISLAFIGAAVLFLPLFVFMPKLIQRGV